MTERAIQVGDLVVVVKPTGCGCTRTLGLTFIAGSESVYKSAVCVECRKASKNEILIESGIPAPNGNGTYGFNRWRLKRIPPLSELEGERSKESITLPSQRPKEPA